MSRVLKRKWVVWSVVGLLCVLMAGWWWVAISDAVAVMKVLRDLDSSKTVQEKEAAGVALQSLTEEDIARITPGLVVATGYLNERLVKLETRIYKLHDSHASRACMAMVLLGERAASQAEAVAAIVRESKGQNKLARAALVAMGPAAAGDFAELLIAAKDEEMRWNLLLDLSGDMQRNHLAQNQREMLKPLRAAVVKELIEDFGPGPGRVMSPEQRRQWTAAVQWVYLVSDDDGATATALMKAAAHDPAVDMEMVRAISFLGKTKKPMPAEVIPDVLKIVERSQSPQRFTVLFNFMERQVPVNEMEEFCNRHGLRKPEDLERVFSDAMLQQEVIVLLDRTMKREGRSRL